MAKGALVNYEDVHRKALHTAAVLFLKQGYTATSVRSIANHVGCSQTAVLRVFNTKEGILCELVKYVIENQFAATQNLLQGITDDPVMFYAAETALQLHMAESDESVRDLYAAAYSLPESAEVICRTISSQLPLVFGAYLPTASTEDFYHLEIASGGIIRGYMTVPCTPDFTIEEKVKRFLESSLRIYRVPEEKIREAVAFIRQFDYPAIAQQTISDMLAILHRSENGSSDETHAEEGAL